jgi:hypothetical protein
MTTIFSIQFVSRKGAKGDIVLRLCVFFVRPLADETLFEF